MVITSERIKADRLAERLLNEPNADPDDDLRILSRQLLRRAEVISRLEARLGEMCDGTLDLVHANRDIILKFHEDAIVRIGKCLQRGLANPSAFKFGLAKECALAQRVIAALNMFHPMHGETRGKVCKERRIDGLRIGLRVFAELIGRLPSAVSAWEAGRADPAPLEQWWAQQGGD